jgi:hypothetical protein
MNYTREKMENFSLVRLILNRMNDELAGAFLTNDSEEVSFLGGEYKLDFISLVPERIFENSKESDLVGIGYFVEPPGAEEKFILWRREARMLPGTLLGDGTKENLIEGLESIEFRYYDGAQWRLEWNSQDEKALPRAVKVTLCFPEQKFSTLALIGCRQD